MRLPVASLISALALAWLATPAQAQQVLPAQSEIGFVSKQMGVPVEGKFKKWSAQLSFDPKKPEGGKVSFAIDTASASFGSSETDAEVVKPEWLASKAFPQASFASSAIKAAGPGRYEVQGSLTIKGQARAVTVPVTLSTQGGNGTATGAFTLKRLAFKVGEGDWADTSMVADEVQVKFKLALAGLPK